MVVQDLIAPFRCLSVLYHMPAAILDCRLATLTARPSAEQVLQLEDVLHRENHRQCAALALARRRRAMLARRQCPHCHSHDVVRHGHDQNRRQRFRCRNCRRTYNVLTLTPLARARKPETWGRYLDCLTSYHSVREIVASGIGLHHVTVWRWRHRFLALLRDGNAALLRGVIEAEVCRFERSFKGSRGWRTGAPPAPRPARRHARSGGAEAECGGVPVLTALDHGDSVYQAILPAAAAVAPALAGRIEAGSVLCSNNLAGYRRAADLAGAEHRSLGAASGLVAASSEPPARLSLARVRAHHQSLRVLINGRCHGVATRYLGNYLAWHRAMIQPGFDARSLLGRALA